MNPDADSSADAGARPEIDHATIRDSEDQRKEPAKCGRINHDACKQAEARLNLAGHQFRLCHDIDALGFFSLYLRLVQRAFETDRTIDVRLAENLAKSENDQTGKEADEHPTYQCVLTTNCVSL